MLQLPLVVLRLQCSHFVVQQALLLKILLENLFLEILVFNLVKALLGFIDQKVLLPGFHEPLEVGVSFHIFLF